MRLAKAVGQACPKCGSEDVIRSHRQTSLDWVMGLAGWRPYRCRGCNRRFHAVPSMRVLARSEKEWKVKEAEVGRGEGRVKKRSWAKRMGRPAWRRAAMLVVVVVACVWAFMLFITRAPA